MTFETALADRVQAMATPTDRAGTLVTWFCRNSSAGPSLRAVRVAQKASE